MARCPRCHAPLIEIDYYGDRLLGCIECNRWGRPGDATCSDKLVHYPPRFELLKHAQLFMIHSAAFSKQVDKAERKVFGALLSVIGSRS
jgi:hypothetical protein